MWTPSLCTVCSQQLRCIVVVVVVIVVCALRSWNRRQGRQKNKNNKKKKRKERARRSVGSDGFMHGGGHVGPEACGLAKAHWHKGHAQPRESKLS